MPSVEVHIAASPTRRFASMLFFLVHSIAARAQFTDPWKIVVTLGWDGTTTPDTRELAWASDFPVEFHRPEPALWAEYEAEARRIAQPSYIYCATIVSQYERNYTSDIVMFLDADTVLVRPCHDVIAYVHQHGGIAAKPAWIPPPGLDLHDVLRHFGLGYVGAPMEYSGWGWSFLTPRHGPPYFNGGFQIVAAETARMQAIDLPNDFKLLKEAFLNRYIWQMAQTMSLVRRKAPWLALDERFNMGIGEMARPVLEGEAGEMLLQRGLEMVADTRTLHYCTPTKAFVRNNVMENPVALDAFLNQPDLPASERELQQAFAPFAGEWRKYFRAA